MIKAATILLLMVAFGCAHFHKRSATCYDAAVCAERECQRRTYDDCADVFTQRYRTCIRETNEGRRVEIREMLCPRGTVEAK